MLSNSWRRGWWWACPTSSAVTPSSLPSWPRCWSSLSRSPSRMMSSSLRPSSRTARYDVGQHVQLGGGLLRVGLHVDQREGERLGGVRPADAKRAHQRLDAKAAQPILDKMHRAFDRRRSAGESNTKRAVVLQGVALLGGASGKVVVPAAGRVDLLDQADQHALILSPHALHGHQLETRKQMDQHVAHAAVGQLGLVEPAELEGGDADGRRQVFGRRLGRRRSGRGRAALGHDLPIGCFAVLVVRSESRSSEEEIRRRPPSPAATLRTVVWPCDAPSKKGGGPRCRIAYPFGRRSLHANLGGIAGKTGRTGNRARIWIAHCRPRLVY